MGEHCKVHLIPCCPGKCQAQACETFRWVGQPFTSCDECGLPYWEHTHEHQVNREAKLFADDMLTRVPISPEAAAACKRHWGTP